MALFAALATLAHARANTEKPPILLVTFGTSDPEARAVFEHVEALTREAFPGHRIYWAYTSDFIRRKMRKRGVEMDSVPAALARIRDDGWKAVVVQSLHMIAGVEYTEIVDAVKAFQGTHLAFDAVAIGRPLLAGDDDVSAVVDGLIEHVFPSEREGEAVVLMGHGSDDHPADLAYLAVDGVLRKRRGDIYLATVEGALDFEAVLEALRARKVRKVRLYPFMTVAGVHAAEDMSGDSPDSWSSQLRASGIEAECVMKGLAAYPFVNEIWIRHLDDAFFELGEGI